MFAIIGCKMKTSENKISLENAIEIAKKEVESRDFWSPQEMDCEGKKIKKKFEIVVWKIPQTPGRFRKVTISAEGVVLGYSKGK